jgi:peroxiredoxin
MGDEMIAYIESVSENDDDTFVVIHWSKEGGGFGELVLITDWQGDTRIKTEYMSREFVREVFNELVNSATLID